MVRLTGMRGDERVPDGMFSYVSLEQRVPQDHPLRAVRQLTDTVLRSLSAEFDALYADSGRPSIAPEYILRALVLQVFYSVRSERLLVEQIDYNLLFRYEPRKGWRRSLPDLICNIQINLGGHQNSASRAIVRFKAARVVAQSVTNGRVLVVIGVIRVSDKCRECDADDTKRRFTGRIPS